MWSMGSGAASGRRKQGSPAESRFWLYRDGLNPLAELDDTGALRAGFVYGTRAHVPDYMVLYTPGGPELYRLVTDHLGSVRLVVRASDGSVAQRIDYDEWGVVLTRHEPGVSALWVCWRAVRRGTRGW